MPNVSVCVNVWLNKEGGRYIYIYRYIYIHTHTHKKEKVTKSKTVYKIIIK